MFTSRIDIFDIFSLRSNSCVNSLSCALEIAPLYVQEVNSKLCVYGMQTIFTNIGYLSVAVSVRHHDSYWINS